MEMADRGNKQREKTSHRPGSAARADVLETTAELASDALAAASEPSHAAPMGGIELLLEIAKLADQVLSSGPPTEKHHHAEPVDPRRCVDPRKRILPR
ncbi:hypothetical protein [Trinickia dinghuensis]|uniref:Uncharacterized protein n=1 Tax=Trinickia dinghuensis TaxID=2291023 RepID=A0A3D8K037_9BURK|nr:hypothetical protein [Trinickia dinghuensis]RDU98773.1 hypothetical protein DWV00_10920 [Trinickia dinghuensis]